jgi:hypothetical protein
MLLLHACTIAIVVRLPPGATSRPQLSQVACAEMYIWPTQTRTQKCANLTSHINLLFADSAKVSGVEGMGGSGLSS